MQVFEEKREESFGREGATVTRTLRVEPYSERAALVAKLLGGVELVGGRLVRRLPHRDPWYPWLWANDVKVSQIDDLNSPGSPDGFTMLDTANYCESGRVVATYRPLEPETAAGRDSGTQAPADETSEKELASESWDFSAQSVTLKNQFWKRKGTNELLAQKDNQVAKTFPKADFAIVRHFCLAFPFDSFTQLVGRVNKSPFATRRYIWPAECLRLDGSHTEEKVTTGGTPYIAVQYKFAVQPTYDTMKDDNEPPNANVLGYVGWNRVFMQDTARWEYPVSTGDPSRKLYLLDENIVQAIRGRTVIGFNLLYHPEAR